MYRVLCITGVLSLCVHGCASRPGGGLEAVSRVRWNAFLETLTRDSELHDFTFTSPFRTEATPSSLEMFASDPVLRAHCALHLDEIAPPAKSTLVYYLLLETQALPATGFQETLKKYLVQRIDDEPTPKELSNVIAFCEQLCIRTAAPHLIQHFDNPSRVDLSTNRIHVRVQAIRAFSLLTQVDAGSILDVQEDMSNDEYFLALRKAWEKRYREDPNSVEEKAE